MAHRIELRARPHQHFAYSGRALLVTNLDGWVTNRGTEGFYADETRLLARDEIVADGRPLKSVAASPSGGDAYLAYAEVEASPTVPATSIYVEVARRLGEGMREEIRIENRHLRDSASFELGICLAADFADLTEAQDGRRQQTGTVDVAWNPGCQEVVFRYGHPDLDRAVAVRIEDAPAPARWQDGSLII